VAVVTGEAVAACEGEGRGRAVSSRAAVGVDAAVARHARVGMAIGIRRPLTCAGLALGAVGVDRARVGRAEAGRGRAPALIDAASVRAGLAAVVVAGAPGVGKGGQAITGRWSRLRGRRGRYRHRRMPVLRLLLQKLLPLHGLVQRVHLSRRRPDLCIRVHGLWRRGSHRTCHNGGLQLTDRMPTAPRLTSASARTTPKSRSVA
jgi:hypothetical protein